MSIEKDIEQEFTSLGIDDSLCSLAQDIYHFIGQSTYNGLYLISEEIVDEFLMDPPERVKFIANTLVEFEYLKIDNSNSYDLVYRFAKDI